MKPSRKARKYIAFYNYDDKPEAILFIRVKARPIYGLRDVKLSYDRLERYSAEEVDNADYFFYDILNMLEKLKLGCWLHEGGGPYEPVQLAEFRRNRDYKAPWMRIYMTHEKDCTLNPLYLLKKKTDKPRYIKVGKKKFKTYNQAFADIERFLMDLKEELGGDIEQENN